MGGAFGRRLHFDFAIGAVKVAQQIDKPVQLVWERTDDIKFQPYRPANYHSLKANTDDKGNIAAWQHHVSGTPIAYMTDVPTRVFVMMCRIYTPATLLLILISTGAGCAR